MCIPGRMIIKESEEEAIVAEDNKKYEELRQNKIGSDSYMIRGT
jgi:hypothetical protein